MPRFFAVRVFLLGWVFVCGTSSLGKPGKLSDAQIEQAIREIDAFFVAMDALHANDPIWNAAKERSLKMVAEGYSLEEISAAGWNDFLRGIESVIISPSDFSATQEQIEKYARTFNQRRHQLWLSSKKEWIDRSKQEELLLSFVREDLLFPLVRDNAAVGAYLRPEQLLKAIIRGAPTPPEESVSSILNRRGGGKPDAYIEQSLPKNHRIMSEVFHLAIETRSPRLVRLGAWIAQQTGERFSVSWLDSWPEAFDYILEGTDFEALRGGQVTRAPMSLVLYAMEKGRLELFAKLAAVEKKVGFSIWWNAQTNRYDSSIASATHSGGSSILQGGLPRLVEKDASEMERLLPGLVSIYPGDPQPVLDRMFYWVARESGDLEKLRVLRNAGANPLAVVMAPHVWSEWCHNKFQFLTGALGRRGKYKDSAYRFLSEEAKQAVAGDLRLSFRRLKDWKQWCALKLYAMGEFRRDNFSF